MSIQYLSQFQSQRHIKIPLNGGAIQVEFKKTKDIPQKKKGNKSYNLTEQPV